jgi:hypothetical protein
MGAETDFLVQSGAGAVGGAIGFGFAYWMYRIQRKSDALNAAHQADVAQANARALADAKRRALLTYVAAEVRRNYHMAGSLADFCKRAPEMLESIAKGRAPAPYQPAVMADSAFHAVLANPDARMDEDKRLLSELVNCYSAIPVWKSMEESLRHETHTGDMARTERAILRMAGNAQQLEEQASLFLKVYNLLIERGVAAEEVPLKLPTEPSPNSTEPGPRRL